MIDVLSSSTSEYISKSDSERAVDVRGGNGCGSSSVGEGVVGDRGIMASAELVVMNVEMLAMEARYFCSLIG